MTTVNPMRVTQRMMVGGSLGSLQQGLSRLADVQERLSTGRVLNRPSDSPTATTAAMRMRASIADLNQYVRNAEDGLGWSGTTDQALASTTAQLRRARELVLQAVNGASSPASREALAVELEQIREGLLGEANTTYLGRPVFGGVTAGAVAYSATGAFVGAPGQVARSVGDGISVRVDVLGTDVFGDGASSVFAEVDALVTALRAGDTVAMRSGLDALATRLDDVMAAQANVGASYVRLEQAAQKGRDTVLDLTSSLSEVENVDLPKAMVDLQMQEVAYQAALAATARVMQPSLVDFLR